MKVASRWSRMAFAVIDRVTPDNDALRGDLLEEIDAGRSHWWLWWQVVGALWRGGWRGRPTHGPGFEVTVVGAIVFVLVSFEAIFVTNVVHWLAFGPPTPDISGYLYVFHLVESPDAAFGWPAVSALALLYASAVALVIGSVVETFDREHPLWARIIFAAGVLLCAALNLDHPIGAQFVTMMTFVGSLLLGGRVAAFLRPPHAAAG